MKISSEDKVSFGTRISSWTGSKRGLEALLLFVFIGSTNVLALFKAFGFLF